jgi:segregation and condensation protein B
MSEAQLRVVEALLFAAPEPVDAETIALHLARGPLGEGADVPALLEQMKDAFAGRGVELVESGGRYSLRTSPDLADYLRHETVKPVKLSRAVSETLAIIAYHQPVTRAEVEAIRGVATSRGVLDYLMQLNWVRPGRRKETPGRPLTWVTTPEFLDYFGLGSTSDLPGMEELRAAGLLEAQEGTTYGVIAPTEEADLPPAADGEPDELPEFLPETPETEEQAELEAEPVV